MDKKRYNELKQNPVLMTIEVLFIVIVLSSATALLAYLTTDRVYNNSVAKLATGSSITTESSIIPIKTTENMTTEESVEVGESGNVTTTDENVDKLGEKRVSNINKNLKKDTYIKLRQTQKTVLGTEELQGVQTDIEIDFKNKITKAKIGNKIYYDDIKRDIHMSKGKKDKKYKEDSGKTKVLDLDVKKMNNCYDFYNSITTEKIKRNTKGYKSGKYTYYEMRLKAPKKYKKQLKQQGCDKIKSYKIIYIFDNKNKLISIIEDVLADFYGEELECNVAVNVLKSSRKELVMPR